MNISVTHPDEFWDFYRRVMLYPDAKPNAAHLALAELETPGQAARRSLPRISTDCIRRRAAKRCWSCTAPSTATAA